jgi:S-adenosylmethionine:tRNA ribosyltransferase-isomerase
MKRSDFHYELPEDLIAQHPLDERAASRMLVLDGASGKYRDSKFSQLPELLGPGDLLVLNDTRVIPARLYARKPTGGHVEIVIEEITGADGALVHLGSNKRIREGQRLDLEGGGRARVVGLRDGLFDLEFDLSSPLESYLEEYGHMPLPPYIRRGDEAEDRQRYQTVFARRPGAVAAPTAGLHFDTGMLERVREAGVETARITLHVGAGTFQPVRTEEVADHVMHAERVFVDEDTAAAVNWTRDSGGRVVCVGTTVVRALESAATDEGWVRPFSGQTRLFIRPGYRFRVVDALLTNFHLPESTLLMLVCAFAGSDNVLAAYRHAVAERYRFFSYGDAMFLIRRDP